MNRDFKTWFVEASLKGSVPTLKYSGFGIRSENTVGLNKIYLDLPAESHLLLEMTDRGDVSIFTPSALRYPIYGRIIGGALILSNQASSLMQENEEIGIKPFVFLRHLAGLPYPEENFLTDIELLQASSFYEFKNGRVEYRKSLLTGGTCQKKEDAIDFIVEHMRPQLSSGQPIAVLVSGGYDSRLNLALASYFSNEYGNPIGLFHEYKDDHEFRVAQALADKVGLPLTTKSRTDFLPVDRSVFLEASLIDLESGFYRENLVRWHHYLGYIQEQMPGCFIWGLGAEAHKGKYYQQIISLEEESERVLGAHVGSVKEIARSLGVGHIQETQSQFFSGLFDRAKEFEKPSSQIDFVHYQTYICNGYGKRCHDLFQTAGMSFPFLHPSFLKMVFSLPRKEKEGFEIVKSAISQFSPQLMNMPFTSANEKSLRVNKETRASNLKKNITSLAGQYRRRIFPEKSKGRQKLSLKEKELINSIQVRSDVTELLLGLAQGKWARAPRVQLDYVVQGFLYLTYCERVKGVKFHFER